MGSDTNLVYSSLMYTSYGVLFARFFYNAYLCKSGAKGKQTGDLLNGTTPKFGNVIQAGRKPSEELDSSTCLTEEKPAREPETFCPEIQDSDRNGEADHLACNGKVDYLPSNGDVDHLEEEDKKDK